MPQSMEEFHVQLSTGKRLVTEMELQILRISLAPGFFPMTAGVMNGSWSINTFAELNRMVTTLTPTG